MKTLIKYILLPLILVISLQARAQTSPSNEEELAAQYFKEEAFDKAASVYEKLFAKQADNYYYQPLLACYIKLKEFDKAEKVIKKLIKANPTVLRYGVDLGYTYDLSGKPEKAIQIYESLLKETTSNPDLFLELATAFVAREKLDYAIKTLLKGRKETKGYLAWHFELAEIYKKENKAELMVNEYLEELEKNESVLQKVKDEIQDNVFGNTKVDPQFLKPMLIQRVQKFPENTSLYDLLIWYFINTKDFESALLHSKAIDKRENESGAKLYELAQVCVDNDAYTFAIEAYKIILKKGESSVYYTSAKIGLAEAMKKKVLSGNYTHQDLLELEKTYAETIKEFGKTDQTSSAISSLANLDAFYLNKTEDAINLLEESLESFRINTLQKAEMKLLLGDILLYNGEIWDAKLYYGQVDKEYKYDAIGQEAKLRNAQLSFYIGEFDWAKSQLDVLKAATSKLIANDAMYLSLLISDNMVDSIPDALRMYAHADMLVYQNKLDTAILILDSITHKYPGHSLSDDVLYKIAQIEIKKFNFPLAAIYLDSLVKTYGNDILADDALFKLAELNEQNLGNKENAKKLYEELLEKFPGSMYVVEARKRYRILRGDLLNQ